MEPSKTVRTSASVWIAICATGSLLFGIEPPADLVEGLGAEAYPERVAAEKGLQAWAAKEDRAAKTWLLNQYQNSANPEIRRGALSVLRAVVLQELAGKRPGYVGIAMAGVQLVEENGVEGFGVEVQSVNPDTPAEKYGMQVNDVIVKLDGMGWEGANAQHEFAKKIGTKRGGDKIRLEILRHGKRQEIELVLAPRPWELGEYREMLQLRGNPFAMGGASVPLDEEQAEDKAFQDWLKEQKLELLGQ